MPASTLVGREHELTTLLDELDVTVSSHEQRVVLLSGELGIGKTRLLNEFRAEAAERYSTEELLTGYGQSITTSVETDAFQAVRECLRDLSASVERARSKDTSMRVVHAFAHHAPDWVQAIPLVGQAIRAGLLTAQTVAAGGNSGGATETPAEQVVAAIGALLKSAPVLLILDDLHWADTATIDLLVSLALRVQGPLMLVLSYRSERTLGNHDVAPALQQGLVKLERYRPDSCVIGLPRLTASETEELIRTVNVEHPELTSRLTEIIDLSGGIPLYAESLCRVDSRGHQGALVTSPPRQVRAAIEERLQFLTTDDQQLLATAATIGPMFEVDYLAELHGTDTYPMLLRLDALMREHELIEPATARRTHERYTFHHPLFGEILRQRAAANAPLFRITHTRLLSLLEREQPWDDELAVRAAGYALASGNVEVIGPLCLDAGRRQLEAGAITKARKLARKTLEYDGLGDNELGGCYELLAECLTEEANHQDAALACEAAIASGRALLDPARATHIRVLLARSKRMMNEWAETVTLLDGLQARGELFGWEAHVLLLRAEVALCGPDQDVQECVRLCERTLDVTDDVPALVRAHGHIGLAHLAAYDPGAADASLRVAIELARTRGHPYAEYEAVHWLSKKAMACLELDEADELIEGLSVQSQVSGVASDVPFHLRDSSRVLGLKGDVHSGAHRFARYIDVTPDKHLDRVATTLVCQVAELEAVRGRADSVGFLQVLGSAVRDDIINESRRSRFEDILSKIEAEPDISDPVAFAVDRLEVELQEAAAAEALFRFDVRDLRKLRQGSSQAGAP